MEEELPLLTPPLEERRRRAIERELRNPTDWAAEDLEDYEGDSPQYLRIIEARAAQVRNNPRYGLLLIRVHDVTV